MNQVKVQTIMSGAIATGVQTDYTKFEPLGVRRTFQVTGFTSAGAGAAVVFIQVSNDGTNFITMATCSLTLGTSVTTTGFASEAAWRYVRANVSSISGTDGEVTVSLGNVGA